MPTLAVIGAHALDAELMGGSIALKYSKKGWKTYIIHMTRGERSKLTTNTEEYGKQLENEMELSALKLNSKCIWMGYKAGMVPEGKEGALDICKILRQIKADVVITHWKGSYHPRHIQTYENVLEGVKLSGQEEVKTESEPYKVRTLLFGENMEDEEGFISSIYVDISEEYDQWFEALNCYELFKEKVNYYPYNDFYVSNSILNGITTNTNKAKALMLPKILANNLLLNEFELCYTNCYRY